MRRKYNRVPAIPVTVDIEKFSHDGRGIARIDGKTTFVEGALPGETVSMVYSRKKSDFDEGSTVAVMHPSTLRVDPICPHYLLCGGCSLQHLSPIAQIHEKQTQLLDLLTRTGHVLPENILPPLSGKIQNYRNKARLSVRFVEKKQSTLIGFREKNNPRFITEINQCSVLNIKVDEAIKPLRQLLNTLSNPRSIAQIEVAAGDDAVALIFRNLEPLTSEDEALVTTFAQTHGFKIYLQPEGMDSVYLFHPPEAPEYLTYALPDHGIQFQFHPTDFTQVNAEINRAMVNQAIEHLQLTSTDRVLDLYCGLGNFSLPMAKYCASVLGIEGSQTMVKRAQENAVLNQISNVQFAMANLDDEKTFDIFTKHPIDKLLLDPPRAGALAIVQKMHKIKPRRIVYISCNPATLARDTDILVHQQGYRLVSAGVMDMFPHTAHVESMAVFEKG